MQQKVYLTFDIETVVTGYSYNPTFHGSVYLGAMYIAHELKKRSQKGTFYISLSQKAKDIAYSDYLECLNRLIDGLQAYENIKIEPHIHAYDLPVGFECKDDRFSAYQYEEQVTLLDWAKNFFSERGISVENFRPGGYNVNDSYYQALKETGYRTSSVLLKEATPNINLLTKEVVPSFPFQKENGIIEYPVTSLLIKSIKRGKEEIVNLSPDFFTIESLGCYLAQLEYINVNFHSFSMFTNRMARENHKGQLKNNLWFFFVERFINNILRRRSIETIHTDTIFRKEFIKWLDYFKNQEANTFFIGE